MTSTNGEISFGGRPCLATVSDPDFMPGSLVMIHSFLKNNRWFLDAGGEIVVIHDQMPPRLRELTTVFDNVIYRQVSEALKEKVEALDRGVPELNLEKRKKRFYSLDLFLLQGYEKIIFCDSDILFTGDISELFHPPYASTPEEANRLMGVGDVFHLTGTAVDMDSFAPAAEENTADQQGQALRNTFNAGFLIVDKSLVNRQHHENLLELLSVRRWSKIRSPRTDQVVFNLYFRDKCRLLNPRYNYLVMHAGLISKKEKIPLDSIKALHFNGKAKPWDCLGMLEAADIEPLIIQFLKKWHNEYLDLLSQVYLGNYFDKKKNQGD